MFEYKLEHKTNFPFGHYDLVGELPVSVRDFIPAVLELSKNEICVSVLVAGELIPGIAWPCVDYRRAGNVYSGEWREEAKQPENLLEQIADRNVVKCHAYGDYGHMHYYVTLE